MPECHRCPFSKQTKTVREAVCVACASVLPDIPPNSHGQTMVSAEAVEGTRFEPRTDADAEQVWGGIDEAQTFSPLDVERFAGFLERLLSLTPEEYRILARRYAATKSADGKPTMAEIGAEFEPRLSKQNVYAKMNNVFAKVPEFEALFPKVKHSFQPWQKKKRAAVEAEMGRPRQAYLIQEL